MSNGAGVAIYFYTKLLDECTPDRVDGLVRLALQATQVHCAEPCAILIRSLLHVTTFYHGRRITDPKGPHLTLSFKDQQQMQDGTFWTVHAYVQPGTHTLVDSTIEGPKPDTTPRPNDPSRRKVVWPHNEEMQIYTFISFSAMTPNAPN